jgi:hypothetical protein
LQFFRKTAVFPQKPKITLFLRAFFRPKTPKKGLKTSTFPCRLVTTVGLQIRFFCNSG